MAQIFEIFNNLLAPALAMPLLLGLGHQIFNKSGLLKKEDSPYDKALTISSALMFCLLFLELLPHSLEGNSQHITWVLFVLGLGCLTPYLAQEILEPLIEKAAGNPCHEHEHELSFRQTCTALSCLTLCSFFDGIRVGSFFSISSSSGWAFFLATLIHLLPQVFILSTFLLRSNIKSHALYWTFFLASFPLGLLVTYALGGHIDSAVIMAFSSGLVINLLFSELIPMATRNSTAKLNFLFFTTGLFALLYLILERVGHAH